MVPEKFSVSLIAQRPDANLLPLFKSPGAGLAKAFWPAILGRRGEGKGTGAAMTARPVLSVGIGGLGAIGLPVVRRLAEGLPGLRLAAVAARDSARAATRLAEFGIAAPVVSLAELAQRADIIIECVPSHAFREIAEPAVEAGRIFMPLSAGALLEHFDLAERAGQSGARIIVP